MTGWPRSSASSSSRCSRSWKWRWLPSPVSGSVRARRIARSARKVERWYRAIASRGPTSAIESAGARIQSTLRISAAEPISVNGITVSRMLDCAIDRNGRRELRATTALVRITLTA